MLSENQKKAVMSKGKNILVSAAAGSGKTFVLTRRVLDRIINEYWDINEFLIVTFTRDAASEMRSRIIKGLRDELDTARLCNDKKLCAHIEKQILLSDSAHISTIDSFCAYVIRQNFHKTPLDPGYRSITAPESAALKRQAVDDVLEELLPKGGYIRDFYNTFITKSGDRAVVEMIYALYEFADNMPYPYRWLGECAEKYAPESFRDTVWQEMYDEYTKKSFEKAERFINEAYGYLKDYSPGAVPKNIKRLSDAYDRLYSLYSEGRYGEYKDVSLTMRSYVLKSEAELMAQLSPFAFGHIEDIELCCKSARRILHDIKSSPPADESLSQLMYEKMQSNVRALTELTSAFIKRYGELKTEKQLADFSDIAHYCLSILRNEDGSASDTAREYRSAFKEIIIDEYQDSNYLQEEILTAVSRSEDGEDNIFMVGDVKQAIYRFRKATPKLFMEKYRAYSENGEGELILLSENYRSRPAVIDACNAVFRQIMDEEIGDVDYTDDTALHCGRDYPPSEGLNVSESTEVMIFNSSGNSRRSSEYEASMTAQRIYDMLYTDPLYIYDSEEGYRPVMKKDIVILMRSMTRGEVFFRALNSIGIDCVFDRSEPLFSSGEVMCITSLLRLIDNPMQDIPLTAVLSSPLYAMSYNELAEIRLSDRDGDIYSALRSRAEGDDGTGRLLKKFFEDLEYYRDFAVNNRLSELLSEIYERSSYFSYAGALPRGGIRQANLRLFREKAEALEKYNYSDLHSFIEYIDSDMSEDVSDGGREAGASVLGGGEDAVRLMTIHKSKGLEFPIVFVSCLGSSRNASDKSKNFIFDRELGIGLKYIDSVRRTRYKTIPYEYITRKYDREENSELMRLLYVAFTRAREKLILTGVNSSLKDTAEEALNYKTQLLPVEHRLKKINPLFWIRSALMRGEFTGNAVFDIKEPDAEDIRSAGYYSASESVDALGCIAKLEKTAEEKEYSELRIREYSYAHINDTVIPSKISITEIKRRTADTEGAVSYYPSADIASLPDFMDGKNGISTARRGTVYHSIMENLDFSEKPGAEDIKALIDGLVQRGVIDADEKKALNIGKIRTFTQSALFERIKASPHIYREAPFVMSMPVSRLPEYGDSDREFVVHGIIDLYFEEEDGYVVVDYKTDRVYKSVSELADKYAVQLKLYAEAIEKNTGRKVRECIIYSFDRGEEINVEL